jgi:hypothetical protein
MNRARDHRSGPAYEQWLVDRQKEIDAEKEAADAAQANDPVAIYAAAANAEAEAQRELVLHGRLSDRYMSDFGAVARESFTEGQVEIAMNEFMAQTPDYVQTKANAAVLVEFVWRNNLSPGARTSYRLAHKILALYAAYPDAEKPVAQQPVQPEPEAVVEPVLSRSEQAILDHHAYVNDVVGTDEMGRQWTEEAIDRELSAKDGLRLRRLFEQGHRGSNLLTIRREILDTKQIQDAERARIAAEDER